jgi:hypothetical protein
MVVSQLDVDSEGILRTVDPGPPTDPNDGATFDGKSVQFGLTLDEVDAIWERIEALIEEVDAGEIELF